MRSDPTIHRPTRRWPMLTAAAVGLAMITSGCISGADAEEESDEQAEPESTELGGEVEWWTINLQANYSDYIQGLIDTYEADNPGTTIKWVDVPGADLATKLLAALAAGEAPDLVNIGSPDLGRFQNSLTDLNDYFSAEELAEYQESLVEPLTFDGAVTALPWYNGGSPVAMYRQEAMEGTSFDPENPPVTYDEIFDVAAEVTDAHGIAGFSAIPGHLVLPYYGVQMLNEDKTEATFNTPEAVAVLEKWKEAYDAGVLAPGSVSKDERNLPENLENRKVGFSINVPAARLVNTEENAPEVYEDVVVTPGVRTPEGKLLLQGQQTFGIPADSDNKATAADWLKFVTNAENQLEFCKIVAIFPSTKATLEDPFFDSQGEEPTDVARNIIVETLPDLEDGALGTSKDFQLGELLAEQVRAFLQGDVDAQTALDNAAEQWNTELQQQ
ncbi:ABC transporter substrate-binding protein [Phytoactinopolyspora halotolerans]|uniref:Extracellular solute-binding protein n=1 Tax=Phytoactinopolyspora halotolerans TaxID=1981512 RepID=A0A6L9SCI6_9ACTN|nr:extracellular solute-binding protein [Phytoactinopolyspora halotolerans]NEE02302.1 extracellular solute-binding protein [Phytoactinopolyspora halotolerans]